MFSCGLKQPRVKMHQSSHVCVNRRASWQDECINMTICLEDLQPEEVTEHFIIQQVKQFLIVACCTVLGSEPVSISTAGFSEVMSA